MKSFLQGLKAAVRSLRRSPDFALVAWLTLSLGIGAVCAVFPLVNAVIVKGLPFQEAERLVFVRGILTRQAPQPLPLGYLDLQALAEQTDVFESISPVTGPRSFNLIGSGEAEHIVGEMVGPDYFRVLRADLALGRMFTADEARPPNAVAVAVLSHSLWRNRFGSDPAVVDRLVDLNGRRVRIIGVASEDLRGLNDQAQIWLPIWNTYWPFGAGILFFPISYVIGDVLTEVYGYARARRVIWAGTVAVLFMAFMSWVVVALPSSSFRISASACDLSEPSDGT